MIYRLHLTIDDQIAHRYLPVPFNVTPGTASIRVQLDYDTSAAVIDLGCAGPGGWRGWSGGARQEFLISAAEATPGYYPGEVEAGTWQVILGLHQIPSDGVDVQVQIDHPGAVQVPADVLAPVRPGPPPGSTREVPAGPGLRWFAGDFHAHTTHSDGAESIDQLAARARAAGLDFVAVTDHNTTSHHRHLAAAGARHGVLLLPGQEVTTSRGHANAFGDIGWVDFRRPAQQWVTDVAHRGGVLSVNHPLDGDCAWQHPLTDLPRALELWHISWFRDLTATGPWALWHRWGAGVVPLGGSDFHHPDGGWTLGTPTTWVAAEENSTAAILAGVAAGRTAISVGVRPDATPDPQHTPLLVRHGEDLLALAADGAVLVDAHGRRRRLHGQRAEIDGDWGTGPFHLHDGERRILAISP